MLHCIGAGADHILVHFYSSRALRRLILGAGATKDGSSIVRKLWAGAFDGRCGPMLGTHAEKVVAALADCSFEDVKTVSWRSCLAVSYW